MKSIFKSSDYLANTGIVFGPYGGVGYYNTNPVTRKITLKRVCVSLRRTWAQGFFKKLAVDFSS
jgi:hypothetical protein